MLYFSKIRIFLITFFSIFFVYIFFSNFIKSDDFIFNKKINLGLYLQGGSYLLLEINNDPVILQKLQNSVSNIKKYLKNKKIIFKNLRIENKKIIFEILDNEIDNVVYDIYQITVDERNIIEKTIS